MYAYRAAVLACSDTTGSCAKRTPCWRSFGRGGVEILH